MKRILYLGLNPIVGTLEEEVVHFPVICTKPKHFDSSEIKLALSDFKFATHLVITSKNGFRYLLDLLAEYNIDIQYLQKMKIFSVGKKTSAYIQQKGFSIFFEAKHEQAEGLIEIFDTLDLKDASLFWPHSQQARDLITKYFELKKIKHTAIAIYDTVYNIPNIEISLLNFDEIVFTSPSTVDGFFQIFNEIPTHIQIKTIGPITESYLQKIINN